MRLSKGILLFLHLVIGIGGLAGGWAAIMNPLEPLGAPLSLLEQSPFENFFIPGLILFIVIGIGNIIAVFAFFTAKKIHVYLCNVNAWALIIWIIVQVWMIQAVEFLHVLFFLLGVFQAVIGSYLLYQQQLFPISFIIKTVNKNRQSK